MQRRHNTGSSSLPFISLLLDWRGAWRQGLLPLLEEVFAFDWAATARLKPGSPLRVWSNKKLTESTKIQVYGACVLSTVLCGNESWTLHPRQEKQLNTFHMRGIQRILNITWQGNVPKLHSPETTWNSQLVYTTETETFALAWPCSENGWRPDPKGSPLRRIGSRKRPTGGPQLRFKDVRKRDLKALGIDINVQVGGKQCSKATRSPKRHLRNRLRQRDKRGTPEFREIDQQLTKSAHCEGRDWHSWMVFPATQGAVQEPPVRARHHSLSRLQDANEWWMKKLC